MLIMSESKPKFVPPQKTFNVEFFVGIFVVIGLLSFAYLAVNIANIRLSDAGYYEIQARFDNISGLKVGAPVEIAGVQIGEISAIALQDTEAQVTMRIEDQIKLRSDDSAAVRTKGIIGDRYIKIIPGSAVENLSNHSKLVETESAVEFEEIIGKLIHRVEG